MNKILFIFLAIFLCSCGICALTEDEANARIDRVVFFVLYQVHNLKNMLHDGTCCGAVRADNSCDYCTFRLQIKRTIPNGILDTFTVWDSRKPATSYEGYVTNAHNVDTKIYTAYNLVHIVEAGPLLYDSWLGVNPKVVGVYPMNGVWGEYYKSLIFAAFTVSVPLPTMPYYSMMFTIRNIEWIPAVPGSYCPKASPFKIYVSVESVQVWTSQTHGYDGTACAYPVKFTGGTDNSIILKENAMLTLAFNKAAEGASLIDSIVIKNINTEDTQRSLEFIGIVGTNGKLKIDLDVKYNCKGYVGKNCVYPCQPIDDITDCKPEDGTRYCKNGADDLKSCLVITDTCHAKPCSNGAKCTAFKTGYFCNCTNGWAGRDCRDSICQQLCYRGVCGENNSCTCNTGYDGRWCDRSSCTETELRCLNGGKCNRMRDNPTCTCPMFASGNDCSKLNCNPICKMGKCEVTPNSDPASVRCTCFSGYKGNACEILISAQSIFLPRDYIYAISGISIAFALLVKIMIVLFFIPNLFKADKTETSQGATQDAAIA